MADENTSTPTGDPNTNSNPTTDANNQNPSTADVLKRLKELEENNRRLEDENKNYKSKSEQDRIKSEEAERLKIENGSAEEKLEFERKEKIRLQQEKDDLSKTVKNIKNKTIDSNLRSKISRLFPDIQDNAIDDVLNQPKLRHILNKGIDLENLDVSDDSIKEYMSTLLVEKPFLRKSIAQESVDTTRPNGREASKERPVSQLSDEELNKLIFG